MSAFSHRLGLWGLREEEEGRRKGEKGGGGGIWGIEEGMKGYANTCAAGTLIAPAQVSQIYGRLACIGHALSDVEFGTRYTDNCSSRSATYSTCYKTPVRDRSIAVNRGLFAHLDTS